MIAKLEDELDSAVIMLTYDLGVVADVADQCTEEPRLENRVEQPGRLDRCRLEVDQRPALRVATIAGEAGEAA